MSEELLTPVEEETTENTNFIYNFIKRKSKPYNNAAVHCGNNCTAYHIINTKPYSNRKAN